MTHIKKLMQFTFSNNLSLLLKIYFHESLFNSLTDPRFLYSFLKAVYIPDKITQAIFL